ncbi:MAG: hypothetical protein ABI741_15405 [Ferruginibacter sp.]
MPDKLPITGKYAVLQIQKFSDSGSLDLPIDIRFVSFLADTILLEGIKNIEYRVSDVVLNETEDNDFYYIVTDQKQLFLLVLNQEEELNINMPYFAKLTSDDGKEGIMYSLQIPVTDL